jgi:hypothetical protein
LVNFGGDACTTARPCLTCQGDCDTDKDCAGSLRCFQRTSKSTVPPGCQRTQQGDIHDYDHCYDIKYISPGVLWSFGGDGCTPSMMCNRCQGDCDSDRDCKSGLRCFQRDKKEMAHQCKSGGSGDITGYDYCVSRVSVLKKLVNFGASGCTPAATCLACQGDCDTDKDCKGSLRCFQRNTNEFVHQCDKTTQGDVHSFDFCISTVSNPNLLANLGGDACTPSKPCSVCQGDCDKDTDCKGALRCWQRDGTALPNGCRHTAQGNVKDYDFCYDVSKLDPKKLYQFGATGCTTSKPCQMCRGDCDADKDCVKPLFCFQRKKHEHVHGCQKTSNGDVADFDYCVSRISNTASMVNFGPGGCTKARQCDKCQGDCDSDQDCKVRECTRCCNSFNV